jgi:anti-anti-sigma factor
MKLTTEQHGSVAIVRVGEERLVYPLLPTFADTVAAMIANGARNVLIDLSPVVYVDSASIGCLMDLYRKSAAAGGTLKLANVQKRVETMLTMTGAQHFIEIHGDEPGALAAFGV